ncbi:T9SS type A sorting domain-containing protein [Puia sp. P3]|uniref:T9SS type A sorting domain-containing protein n=1 Tax=Puia sp. P3 TaxID=3423952 RepID=UPI003D66A8BD
MIEGTSSPTYATHYNSLKKMWTNSAAFRAAYPECADMVGNGTPNISYWSKIWPSFTGCVFTANPGIFSNTNIDSLFNRDGTTNSTYARTGPAFTKWNAYFQDNFRLNGGRTTPILPFIMDSLLKTGAFNYTKGKDWHLNRIGLHKDQYRTDVTGLTIPGADPKMKLNFSSASGLKTPGSVTLTMGIKFPNAANVISATYWLDNGKAITGLSISKKSVAYDSIVYIATWTNPPAGTHTIKVQGNDGDGTFWQYFSNTVTFTVTSTAAAATSDSTTSRVANAFNDSTAATAARSADSARAAGLDSLNALSLSLYPNPARSILNVTYNSASAQQVDLYVYDMLGRIMVKKTADMQAGANLVALPVSGLPTGSYLLTVQSKFSTVNARRFVVQH